MRADVRDQLFLGVGERVTESRRGRSGRRIGQRVEIRDEVPGLLDGHFRRGGETRALDVCGIAEREDAVIHAPARTLVSRAEHTTVVVRQNPLQPFLADFDVNRLDQRDVLVPRRPDEHAVGNAALVLDMQGLVVDFFDAGVDGDVDFALFELPGCVFVQFVVVCREDVGRDVVDGNAHVLGDLWVDVPQLALAQVIKFGGEFDTCGSAADDGDVQQLARAFGRDVRQRGLFEKIEERFADFHRVGDVFDEDGVGVDTGGVEGVGHASRRDGEVVVLDVEFIVCERRVLVECRSAAAGFGIEVDIQDIGLDEAQGTARFRADGFFGKVEVEQAHGGGSQEGGICRCATRGDQGHVVGLEIDVLGHVEASPAGADNDQAGFGRHGWG